MRHINFQILLMLALKRKKEKDQIDFLSNYGIKIFCTEHARQCYIWIDDDGRMIKGGQSTKVICEDFQDALRWLFEEH